jgi:hypothetical protein
LVVNGNILGVFKGKTEDINLAKVFTSALILEKGSTPFLPRAGAPGDGSNLGGRPFGRAQSTGQLTVGELRHRPTSEFRLNPKFDIDYCRIDSIEPRQNKRENCLVGEYN